MKKLTFGAVMALIISSCTKDDYIPITSSLDSELLSTLNEASNGEGVSFFTLPESDDYANIPQDPLNLITEEKVFLGKLLLHETATGGNPKMSEMKATYSCASCHQASAGFAAGIRQGIGECGVGFGIRGEERVADTTVPRDSIDVQPIKSPTLLNVAYQDVMLWNGQFGGTGTNAGTEASWTEIQENFLGFQGVEVQAIKGQKVHRLQIDDEFVNTFGYKDLFDAAFSDVAENERYTKDNAALAIAAYERTLLANKSPWQDWLKGNSNALSDSEKKGAIAFFGKGKCYECHTGPALNDKDFHSFGMGDFENVNGALLLYDVNIDNVKRGRGNFTNNPADDFKFKTPTLYNLIDNGFYGHGGTFTSIKEIISYKNEGNPQNTEVPKENLASQFGTINLTEEEIDNMTSFVTNSLRDSELSRYVPGSINSGNCFPNNDYISREDLGCD
ncbi:cytochrome-c peroxidase [Aquimarina sp. BL5]|uniref:cytochrome-c peroxidase n=1 Tax=Aquimarina sp. BL5 TaxID=1714860 RepID=UPI000E47A55E|nr:cytochrome c peroxidase [Aquimarina sp. BL5]AXT52053.1 cytochrome-c peroxidase [Aquimarina sp. BL5]RKN11165.1 cytochrome-c peroxidase [Aquimarina sp. BL5]